MKRVIAWIIVSVVVLALAALVISGSVILVTRVMHGDQEALDAAGNIGIIVVGTIIILALAWAIAELCQ